MDDPTTAPDTLRSEARRAIVVGGGIAGLATACGLLRLGWDVTIYEAADKLAPLGAGIVLAPNAVRALDWLGLADELRSRALAHGVAGVRDASGRWLFRSRLEDVARSFGEPTYALHRAELHGMLLDAARGAALQAGSRVVAIEPGELPMVWIDAPDGSVEESADLVVGADGIGSAVRRALFPAHPGPTYAGYVAWRGIVPAVHAPAGSHDVGVTETWGRGQRFGLVPLGDGQVYWYATASLPAGSHPDDDPVDLGRRFADWHQPIPALLARTPPESLLRHDISHVATPLPRYHDERVVLIGDAAHAMTPDLGQGAGAALEDAVTLVDALRGASDVPSALARFDERRRRRTQGLVRTSAAWGRVAQWRQPAVVAIRNAVTRLTPAWLFLRLSANTLGWRPPERPLPDRLPGTAGGV